MFNVVYVAIEVFKADGDDTCLRSNQMYYKNKCVSLCSISSPRNIDKWTSLKEAEPSI